MTAAAPLPVPTAEAVDASRWSVSMHRLRDPARLDAAIAFARAMRDHGVEECGEDRPFEYRAGDQLLRVRLAMMTGGDIIAIGTDRTADVQLGVLHFQDGPGQSLIDADFNRRSALSFVRERAAWLADVLETAARRPSSIHLTPPHLTEDDPRIGDLARVATATAVLSGRTGGPLFATAPTPWEDFRVRDDAQWTITPDGEVGEGIASTLPVCLCVDDRAPEGSPKFDFAIVGLGTRIASIDPVEAMRIVSAHRSIRP